MKLIQFILALLLTIPVMGQKGKVAGTLTDKNSGETLISAYIYVEGTDIVEASDFDGKYSIELDPGTYTLKYTYIGFGDKLVNEVVVKDGEVTYLDVAMDEGSEQLDEVVVTARIIDKTENSVLLLRKKSDQIQDGLSSQEMRKFAVGSVASAVTKVTAVSVEDGKYVNIRGLGDRYSISQLNGLALPSIDPYRNSAQLDLIPTNLLDNIITSKTFSPDQPGNFAGGNLNIKTKSFPEARTFSVSLSTGYNPQTHLRNDFLTHDGGNLDWLGYGSAARARPDIFDDPQVKQYMTKNAELFARIQGNEEAANTIDKVVNAVDRNFVPHQTTQFLDRGVSVSYGNSWSVSGEGKLGILAAASYQTSFQHIPDLKEERWFLFSIDAKELINLGQYQGPESTINPVLNGLFGLAYKFNNLNSINFNLVYNHNSEKESEYFRGPRPPNIENEFIFEGRSNLFREREMINYQLTGNHVIPAANNLEINWSGSYVNAGLNAPNLRYFSNQFNLETGKSSIPLSNVDDPLMFWRNLDDEICNGKIDFEFPVNLGLSAPSKIKFGGLYSAKDRNFDEFRYIFFSPPNGNRFDGDFEAFLGDDNVGILDKEETSNKTRYIIGNYLLNNSSLGNAYVGTENITAAYLMGNFQLTDQFKIVAGARYEYTDISVASKDTMAADSVRFGNILGGDLLPSVNMIYSLSENMNLRGSYNHTLARPNLREIAPFSQFDPITTEFIIGNPGLKKTNIVNADLRWELFLQPGEIVSAGVFYKSFTNPIVSIYRNSTNPELQFSNVDKGNIYGLEFEFRKNLDFITPVLKNYKFSSNVALIKSSTIVEDQTGEGLDPAQRPFVGQAPLLLNASINYSLPESNFDAVLAYNYTADKLSNISRNGTPDVYQRARHQLDFTLAKKFDRISLALSVKNILNDDYTRSMEFFGNEYIYRSYRLGQDVGLTISYNL
ncbi:TonB-dependent receptor [Portibacter marinus]|uniref:TonB-dependent receptor n=1 Tax=Portibacter marinus TaxID=2898660 RepID=UPI001F2030E4|nr:TonB-dependent receptor [Portibacter marinus]